MFTSRGLLTAASTALGELPGENLEAEVSAGKELWEAIEEVGNAVAGIQAAYERRGRAKPEQAAAIAYLG